MSNTRQIHAIATSALRSIEQLSAPQGPQTPLSGPAGMAVPPQAETADHFELKDVLVQTTITAYPGQTVGEILMSVLMAMQPQLLEKIKENLEEKQEGGKTYIRCRLGVIPMKHLK